MGRNKVPRELKAYMTAKRTSFKRKILALIMGTGTVLICLLLLETGFRMSGGYRVFSRRLVHPTQESSGRAFFEPNKLKTWNANYVAQRPEQFADWPVDLQTFDVDDVHPHYLFMPNLRITRDGNTLRPAREGDPVYWSSNEYGMRGEPVGPKEEGLIRILCLGASTTEGSQDDNTTYPVYLQTELNTRYPGNHFQVLNGGHHAYNAGDCVAFLKRIIGDVQPDLVIWYEAANDIYYPNWTSDWPSIKRRMKGGLKEEVSRYSAVARALGFTGEAHRRRPVPHDFLNRPDNPSLLQWQGHLRSFIAVCRQHGVEPVLTSYATIVHDALEWDPDKHVHLDRWIAQYKPFTPGEVAAMYDSFNEAARDLARETGCSFIDLAAEIPKSHDVFWDGVHFHPEANRKFASTIAEGLDELLPLNQHSGSRQVSGAK